MRNSKKIIWHYPHLYFWMGGTKFIYEVLRRLSKKYTVTIICNSGSTEVKSKFKKEDINIIFTSYLTSNSLLYWSLFPLFLIFDFIRSASYMQKTDKIVATLYPSNLICALFNKITNKPYYYYCFEPFPFLQNQEFIETFPYPKKLFMKILSLLYSFSDSWATRQAKKVFTLNQVTKRMIMDCYNVDSVVSLMGVDSDHFSPKKTDYYANSLRTKNIIVHSTDYTTMKNTDLAIKTLKLVLKKHKDAVLVITSTRPNAPEKRAYENLATKLNLADSVKFLDLVDYEKLPELYSSAVCYLSCSYDEMLGTTSSNLPVKESLACETPAIRANITTEDVEEGVSGYLVDPRDTKEVAEKIVYLIEHPKIRDKMGVAGRKKITTLYNWDNVAKTILKHIEKDL